MAVLPAWGLPPCAHCGLVAGCARCADPDDLHHPAHREEYAGNESLAVFTGLERLTQNMGDAAWLGWARLMCEENVTARDFTLCTRELPEGTSARPRFWVSLTVGRLKACCVDVVFADAHISLGTFEFDEFSHTTPEEVRDIFEMDLASVRRRMPPKAVAALTLDDRPPRPPHQPSDYPTVLNLGQCELGEFVKAVYRILVNQGCLVPLTRAPPRVCIGDQGLRQRQSYRLYHISVYGEVKLYRHVRRSRYPDELSDCLRVGGHDLPIERGYFV